MKLVGKSKWARANDHEDFRVIGYSDVENMCMKLEGKSKWARANDHEEFRMVGNSDSENMSLKLEGKMQNECWRTKNE